MTPRRWAKRVPTKNARVAASGLTWKPPYVNWRVAVTTFCTRLDGKEYPYYSRIADSIKATGSNWGEFVATISEGGKVVRTTHAVVSKDGKTLTRTTTYAGERGTDLQVYDKQPNR